VNDLSSRGRAKEKVVVNFPAGVGDQISRSLQCIGDQGSCKGCLFAGKTAIISLTSTFANHNLTQVGKIKGSFNILFYFMHIFFHFVRFIV
jgi:hypothetical protein